MKKALFAVAAVALAAWVVSWFWAGEAVATSAAKPWPGGIGTLDSVAARYPPQQANDASRKLKALAGALPQNEAGTEFVAREIERGRLAIGQPPALPDLTAVRKLLLSEPVVWGCPGGVHEIGDQETQAARAVQMTLSRLLVASALAQARAGDPAAWEELRAVWNLARSLDGQPQVMTQTAALSMVRMINAVAWKMPLPVAPWFTALQERDPLRRLVEAFQYQAASYWESGANLFPTRWLAASVERDRLIAAQLLANTGCDVNAPMNDLGVDLSSVWRRAFRYRAEREATANALRLRDDRPITPASRCTDGSWTSDGKTLRFSREIKTASPDRPIPLVLDVQP